VGGAYFRILSGLALLVVLALILGWTYARTLPPDLCTAATLELDVPSETIWLALADISSYPQWRPGLREVKQPSLGENTVPKHWTEIWENGDTLQFEMRKAVAPDTLGIGLLPEPGRPYQAEWTWVLQAAEGGRTQIKLVHHLHITTPFYKIAAHLFRPRQEGLLQNLQALGQYLAPKGK